MSSHREFDHSIGSLLGITFRKLSFLLQQRLKPYDITPEQWAVLYHIGHTNGSIQKDIAERSGKDRSTTTRIIDHLEAKELIYKKTGVNDRRSFLVYTTEKGRQILEATTPIEQGVTDDVKQCMTEEELNTLMELLTRINHHADQLTP